MQKYLPGTILAYKDEFPNRPDMITQREASVRRPKQEKKRINWENRIVQPTSRTLTSTMPWSSWRLILAVGDFLFSWQSWAANGRANWKSGYELNLNAFPALVCIVSFLRKQPQPDSFWKKPLLKIPQAVEYNTWQQCKKKKQDKPAR